MRKVKLSEVCDISSGGTPSRTNPEYFNGNIPWAKISDIESANNGIVYETEEYISAEGLKNIRGKLFPKGTLLFAMYGSIGKVGITGREISTNQAILGIRPRSDDEIDLNYLKSWFESNKQKLINQGRGAALKNLSATIVRNLEIDLPPLDDQIRIAHLLGKVEGLITQRKQNLQQLDDLLKSVFLAMFGDPVKNEKGWQSSELNSFIDQRRGISYGIVQRGEHLPGGVPVLRIRDIIAEEYFEDDLVRTVSTNSEKYSRTILQGGELLLSIRGTVGAVSVAPPHSIGWNVSREIAIIPVIHGINKNFLINLLKSPPLQLLFSSMIKGVAQSGLNLSDIRRINIILPPTDIQTSFEKIALKIQNLSLKYRNSLSDLESLYRAFSQQAFKGELDLSRMQLLAEHRTQSTKLIDTPTSVKIKMPLSDFFRVPESAITIDVKTTDGRKNFLTTMLSSWLEQFSHKPFSITDFMGSVQSKLWDLTDRESNLNKDDYDEIKSKIFDALETGRLKQVRNMDHCIIETKEIVYGNVLELKAGVQT